MQNIDLLKESVNGVDKSFLIKEGEIAESDFEKERVYFLSKNIPLLMESILASKKNIKKISIVADKYFQIFYSSPYILGVVVSRETNFPLLEMVSNKLLLTIEEPMEKTKEAVDDVLQRMDAFLK